MSKPSQYERLKAEGRKQVVAWLSADTAALLAELAAASRKTQVEIIEEAIRGLASSSGSSVADVQPESISPFLSRLETIEGVIADMGSQVNAIQESIFTVVSTVSGLAERLEVVEVMGKQGSDLLSDSDRELMALGNVDPADLLNKKNGVRNRRILEMHRDGMNPGAIAAVLEADGLPRSGRGCVEPFLKKCGITPHLSR